MNSRYSCIYIKCMGYLRAPIADVQNFVARGAINYNHAQDSVLQPPPAPLEASPQIMERKYISERSGFIAHSSRGKVPRCANATRSQTPAPLSTPFGYSSRRISRSSFHTTIRTQAKRATNFKNSHYRVLLHCTVAQHIKRRTKAVQRSKEEGERVQVAGCRLIEVKRAPRPPSPAEIDSTVPSEEDEKTCTSAYTRFPLIPPLPSCPNYRIHRSSLSFESLPSVVINFCSVSFRPRHHNPSLSSPSRSFQQVFEEHQLYRFGVVRELKDGT